MIKEFNTYLAGISIDRWISLFRERGTLKQISKGDTFIQKGSVAGHLGFVHNGSFKYVVYTSDGTEKIVGLETDGGFIASFPYCLDNLPSVVSIVANTDSQVYCLSVDSILDLCRIEPAFAELVNKSMKAIFYNLYDRFIELYALSPKERYEKLLKDCPRLFDVFRLKEIASYLNITPEYLSRLRKNIR